MTHNFPERHIAIKTVDILKGCTEEWKVDIQKNVTAVIMDNAQNVQNAVIDCLLFPGVACSNQSLILAVQDGLGIQEVQTAVAQTKEIVISLGWILKLYIKDKQKELDLPQHEQVTHVAVSMHVMHSLCFMLYVYGLCAWIILIMLGCVY